MSSNFKKSILLIGDIMDDFNNSEVSLIDSDNPTESEVLEIANWIEQGGYEVKIQRNVREFVASAGKFKDFVVFPLWRGGYSRNRTSIVPAVCEANEIPYVGADTFVQSVCQDKSVSKDLCRKAGIVVPNEMVIYSLEQLYLFSPTSHLKAPFVVKPLFSACSIGINNNSLCSTDGEAKERVKDLFRLGLGPVMCEEFMAGDEVSLCFIEEQGRISLKCESVFLNNDGSCPFYNRLYTFEDKMNDTPSWNVAINPKPVDEVVWQSVENLVRQLGKVDYMRVDGRLHKDKFSLIELTPDINLSLSSAFVGGFNALGHSPSFIIEKLIQASTNSQKDVYLNVSNNKN